LRRYEIPALLFVPTAYPDQPEQTFWWDDLYQALQNTYSRENLDTPIGTFSLSHPVSRNQAYQRLKNYLKTLKHSETISNVKVLCRRLGVQPAPNCIMRAHNRRSHKDTPPPKSDFAGRSSGRGERLLRGFRARTGLRSSPICLSRWRIQQ
jgi:hypothetical protein